MGILVKNKFMFIKDNQIGAFVSEQEDVRISESCFGLHSRLLHHTSFRKALVISISSSYKHGRKKKKNEGVPFSLQLAYLINEADQIV